MAWLGLFFVFITIMLCKIFIIDTSCKYCIEKNLDLINARIDRASQEYSVKVSEQEFKPNYFLEAFANTMEEKIENCPKNPYISND